MLIENAMMLKANNRYKRLIGRLMLRVHLEANDISIKPLQSVKEFYEEGKMMHHCVFTNKYFTRQHCLILSAKRKDKRLATIELNTDSFRIVQCRGPHNSVPTMDELIRETITKNMTRFQSAKARMMNV